MKRTEPASRGGVNLRFTPSGVAWLVGALGIGVYVWYKSINLVLIIAYAMVVLAILNGLLAWLAVRRTQASRRSIPPIFAGERAECGVTVANESTLPITVTVADCAGELSNTFFVYRLPRGQSHTCTASREFPARGRFGGPVTLSSGFPFGFLECVRSADSSGEIVVLPQLGFAEPDGLRRWLSRQSGGDGRARRVLRRLTSDQAEVRGVRQYRPGDALREVHWRTTARRGEMMVREYDTAPSPELVLVVEPWLPTNPSQADRDRLEATLSLATTIAVTWRRAFDCAVVVVVVGHEPATATANSEEDLREALTPLADIVGSEISEAIPSNAFGYHLARGARVVVSTRPNTPFAGVLARSTGKPFVAVSPTDHLPWYLPPKANDKMVARVP